CTCTGEESKRAAPSGQAQSEFATALFWAEWHRHRNWLSQGDVCSDKSECNKRCRLCGAKECDRTTKQKRIAANRAGRGINHALEPCHVKSTRPARSALCPVEMIGPIPCVAWMARNAFTS